MSQRDRHPPRLWPSEHGRPQELRVLRELGRAPWGRHGRDDYHRAGDFKRASRRAIRRAATIEIQRTMS